MLKIDRTNAPGFFGALLSTGHGENIFMSLAQADAVEKALAETRQEIYREVAEEIALREGHALANEVRRVAGIAELPFPVGKAPDAVSHGETQSEWSIKRIKVLEDAVDSQAEAIKRQSNHIADLTTRIDTLTDALVQCRKQTDYKFQSNWGASNNANRALTRIRSIVNGTIGS